MERKNTEPILTRLECDVALTPAGKPLNLAYAGISVKGAVGTYLWCRICRRSHLMPLDRLMGTLCTMQYGNTVYPATRNYKEYLAQTMMELLQGMGVSFDEMEVAWRRAEIRRRLVASHRAEDGILDEKLEGA